MVVAQDLDLDVARTRHVALEEDPVVAEAAAASRRARRDGLVELGASVTMRMPLPPPPAAAFTISG